MIRKLFLAVGLAALVTVPLHAQDSAAVAKAINDLEGQWAVSLAAAQLDRGRDVPGARLHGHRRHREADRTGPPTSPSLSDAG